MITLNEQELKEVFRDKAHEYAIETTNTRCSHMGDCDGCTIRFCDYKSRLEAFLFGVCAVSIQAECDLRNVLNDLSDSITQNKFANLNLSASLNVRPKNK